VHRARCLPAHHQKQVCPVLGREKEPAHEAKRIRVRERFLAPETDFSESEYLNMTHSCRILRP
jgi:hypothetical protein